MKSSKSIVAFVAASLFVASLAFGATEPKKDAAPAAKVAGCCAKAKTAGKACDHGCCVAAAKEGNNCAKCGGAGKVEVKK
ncbi:MAG TPA: hypothetical protein VM029_14440 [Opitutaceae bacterium]|nr:hypothetical protein [Opitutaceae bacterium]